MNPPCAPSPCVRPSHRHRFATLHINNTLVKALQLNWRSMHQYSPNNSVLKAKLELITFSNIEGNEILHDVSNGRVQKNSKWELFFPKCTLFPRRDKKVLGWTPLTTVPKKFHYFSNLKNVSKTWFRRPINDLIELCFLWFYMCFCKINHLNRYFVTLYGLFSSCWPNRVIIW